MTAELNQIWSVDSISQPDMAAEGIARMLIQYQQAPRLKAFIRAFLTQIGNIDKVSLEVLAGIWLATAIGVQLDRLGKIVGQERGELEDEEYRVLLRGRIFVNRADGQVPQFIELLVDILGLTELVKIREYYPAELRISITDVEYPEQVIRLLADMGAGGVMLDVVYSELSEIFVFTTSTDYVLHNVDVNRGTASHDGSTGGRLAGLRRS